MTKWKKCIQPFYRHIPKVHWYSKYKKRLRNARYLKTSVGLLPLSFRKVLWNMTMIKWLYAFFFQEYWSVACVLTGAIVRSFALVKQILTRHFVVTPISQAATKACFASALQMLRVPKAPSKVSKCGYVLWLAAFECQTMPMVRRCCSGWVIGVLFQLALGNMWSSEDVDLLRSWPW